MLKAKRRYKSTDLSNGKVYRKFAKFLVAGMLSTTQALLTDLTGVQLSASALYEDKKDNRYTNCLQGLADERFLTYDDKMGDCCAKTGNDSGVRFFQVQMSDFTTIRTVLIANPEGDNNESSLIGSDLFVGFGTAPGVPCNALPKKSGVYDCNGLVGDFLRYELNTSQKARLAVCEIRAYSLKANEVGSVVCIQGKQSGCPNTPLQSVLDNIPWRMQDQRCVQYAIPNKLTSLYNGRFRKKKVRSCSDASRQCF